MGDFGKNNPCRLISSEKKFLQTNNWGEKFTLLKKKHLSWLIILTKNLTPLYVGEKNSITRGLKEKKSYPNQIAHIPHRK